MSDRLQEIKRRAMLALKSNGSDAVDPLDGHVTGIKAKVGDVSVTTSETIRLYVVVLSSGKCAYKERDDGYVTVHPKWLDKALENLRTHQVLDDLADS